MSYLIIGGNGQLGCEWNRFLTSRNINFDSYSSTEIDITNTSAVDSLLDKRKPNFVVNCAAYTKVDLAEDERERADLINHKAVEKLANICASKKIKLIHYSTDYVFSGLERDRQSYPDGYPEDAPTDPVNHYGQTKLDGEHAIQASGVEHLILRVSWLCGTYGNNFVKTMLRLGKERDRLNVVDDQFGVPTFCCEVVDQTVKLLEKDEQGVFHLGSEGLITWFSFARRIFELSGVEVDVKKVSSSEFKTKAKRPHFSKLNISKIEKTLGEKSIGWETGLSKLLKTIK